jgi:hypothetical protein
MNLIKVAFDPSTKLYLIKLPSDYNTEFEINGKPAIDPMNGSLRGKEFYTSEKPVSIVGKKSLRQLSHYVNREDSSVILSVEEYRTKRDGLLSLADYEDHNDEPVFTSVKIEAEWIIFNKTYTEVYKDVESDTQYEIEIIEYPVSEYPEITPLYSLDAKDIYSTKCRVQLSTSNILRDILVKRGLTESHENAKDNNFHIPKHSGIRFAKINDKYLSGAEDAERKFSISKIDTYENCVAFLNRAHDEITTIVDLHFAKNSSQALDAATIGEMTTYLNNLAARISELDVKTKDRNSQIAIHNGIIKQRDLLVAASKK